MTDDDVTEVIGAYLGYWPRVDETEAALLCNTLKPYGKIEVLATLKRHYEGSKFAPKPVDILGKLRKRHPKVETAKVDALTWDKFFATNYPIADGEVTEKVEFHVRAVAEGLRDMRFPPCPDPKMTPERNEAINQRGRVAMILHLRQACLGLMAFHKYNVAECAAWVQTLLDGFGFTAEVLERYRQKPSDGLDRKVPERELGKPAYVQVRELSR